MSKFNLKSQFEPAGDQPKAIDKLTEGLEKDHRWQTLLGVTGSGKTFTVANIIEKIQKPTLVMAPNKTLAAQLYQEYKEFFPENRVCYFVSYYDYYQPEAYMPVSDTYIQKEAMINEEIDRFRHLATSSLLQRKDVIVVASVSCIYNLGLPDTYLQGILKLEIDKPITRGDLIKQLIKMGFERNNTVVERGEFRVRGDVFEIQAAGEQTVFRVRLENQKIAHLAITDGVTRNILEEPNELVLFPPRHFVTTKPEIERALKDIKEELDERLEYFKKNNMLLEAERLERRTRYDMEMIRRIGFCHGIENYSRHLTGKLPGDPPETLLSYFKRCNGGVDGFLTVMDESHLGVPQVRGMFEGDRARKEVLVEHGWRLPSALDNRPLNFKEFKERIGQVIFTSATPGIFEEEHSEQVVEQIVRPTGLVDPPIDIRPVFSEEENRSQIDDVMEEAEKNTKTGGRTIVITLTKKQAEELSEYFDEKGFRSRYIHSDTKTLERSQILEDFRNNEFDIIVGINLLREGLDLPEVTLVCILDADREGFLRSETSLIQTMGRAARNVDGRIILYADNVTGSMKRAIEECERRREIQMEYNKKHGIKPKSIEKGVRSLG